MRENKKCSKCQQTKSVEEFPYNNRNYGRRGSYCKDCKNLWLKEHYKNNDSRQKKIKDRNKKVIEDNVFKINEYLKSHPCVDCGETDLVVLEFDHVEGEKKFAISARKFSATKWETLAKEIEKCEVRCANCHRRKTMERKIKY